jgi:hypothetical protein
VQASGVLKELMWFLREVGQGDVESIAVTTVLMTLVGVSDLQQALGAWGLCSFV